MNPVRQLLKVKGNQVWSLSKDSTVLDGLNLMAEYNIGAVLVLEEGRPIGIFTERDHLRKLGAQGKRPEEVLIEEVMSRDLLTVSPDQSVRECMALMTEHRIRHLPVIEDGQLIGLISIGDVVKDMIEELEFLVDQLQRYITGLR